MQLHVCPLLFLITTAKILAWSDQRCGGNVHLDQEPFGNITLSLPGLSNDTSPINQRSNETPQLLNCTWVLDVPLGRTLLLKVVLLESDWRIFLRCVCCEEEQDLQNGETALLSGCDRDKATISWTGAGRSSNSVQMVYYVQENERNSSEGRSTVDPSGWSDTGTTIKTVATDAQEVEESTEEGRSPLYEDLQLRFDSQFASSTSSLGDGPRPTVSPLQGLPVSGRADRETLPLPEEKLNNRAETSGASHLTSDLTSAQTLSYFQHTVNTGLKSQTETPFFSQTETPWTDSSVSRSIVLLGHAQREQRVSSSSELIISPSEKPTWGRNTIPFPHGGAITQTPEDKQALSWTSQQSTDRFNSDLTSATISDPLISTKPPQHDSDIVNTENQPTSFSPHAPSRTQSPDTHITGLDPAVGTVEAALVHPHTSRGDSFIADVSTQTAASEEKFDNTDVLHPLIPSTQSQTSSPETTETLVRSTLSLLTPTVEENMQKDASGEGTTSGFTGSFSTTGGDQTRKIPNSTAAATPRETHTVLPVLPTDSATTDSHTLQTHFPHTASTSFFLESSSHVTSVDHKTKSEPSQTSHSSHTHHLPSSTNIPTYKQSPDSTDTVYTSLTSTIKSDYGEKKARKDDKFFPSIFTKQTPTFRPTSHHSMQNHLDLTPSALTPPPVWSSTISPMFYIVPNQPATIRVESVELLLQIVVEESSSALIPGLEEETAAWVLPYLQRAPGFSKLLGVWSSGHAVQSLVVFKTSGALQWLSMREPVSLLEQTGLAQAVHEGRMFRSSNITNITLGGLQGDVCDWLLQCPAGYKCIPEPGTTNYSCSSVCRFDFCHHRGICTHHPGQLPVCRCLVGEDFWYMGQRCDVRMTQVRLLGVCLAILLIIASVIGILALVAVRRYRTILIQAKVDQTRSSYRRFNHFDELSGRFWLRSWAGSADSLDNPAFTRSDELLHLRALDRTCCYHDDTLSLASTCPSRGAHISTIYPHSSQYGWRGSEVSVGDGVLDSGKASDLSVCSWPVEPIHWTPFPLLQQLASHRTHTVRVSRPRSYCEGMELVDMGKSWTA